MVSFAIPEEDPSAGDAIDAYDLVERYEHRFWEARDCFSLYDNGKGRIKGGVVAEALARFGARPDGVGDDEWASEVAIAMRECGCDANGTVNFNAFKRVYNHTKGLAEKDSRGAKKFPLTRSIPGPDIHPHPHTHDPSMTAEASKAFEYIGPGDLPNETFTEGPALRDPTTGGIVTAIVRDFVLEKTLGTGGFAVVKLATHVRTGRRYAVKIMNVTANVESGRDAGEKKAGSGSGSGSGGSGGDAMSLEEIAEEIRITISVNKAKNAVKVYDFYQTSDHVYVVMELLEGGDLLDALLETGGLEEGDAARVMKELLEGMRDIHDRSITHRDLKLENIIMARRDDFKSLRIADFGLAKKMKTARSKMAEQCGTPAYVAPEVIGGQPYTPAVDMWAAGVIMYAMMCTELPFDEDDQLASFRRIGRGDYHEPCVPMSADARGLLDGLLCVDKVQRLTASEALGHRWIRRHAGKLAGGVTSRSLAKSRTARAAESKLGGALETRALRAGDLLIRKGERAKEVYLIKEGRCEVVIEVDGKEVIVAERGEGEFIGEMGVKLREEAPDGTDEPKKLNVDFVAKSPSVSQKGSGVGTPEGDSGRKSPVDGFALMRTLIRVKNRWVGGRRGANVRAKTDLTVTVINGQQMQWILEHDYGADGEMAKAIKDRKKALDRAQNK